MCAEPTIETKIINLISDQSDFTPDKISPSDKIIEDLGLDSLDCIELTMALEEEFNIEISDEDAEQLLTVEQIINYVKTKTEVKP